MPYHAMAPNDGGGVGHAVDTVMQDASNCATDDDEVLLVEIQDHADANEADADAVEVVAEVDCDDGDSNASDAVEVAAEVDCSDGALTEDEAVEVEACDDDSSTDEDGAVEVEAEVELEDLSGRKAAAVQSDESDAEDEVLTWACCDRCSKWRRVPTTAMVPDEWWECSMLEVLGSCEAPQELLDEDEEEEEEEFRETAALGVRAATWVQCDICSKWRSLPRDHEAGEGRWECPMNPRAAYSQCSVAEEELEDDEEEAADAAVAVAENAADAALEEVECAQVS